MSDSRLNFGLFMGGHYLEAPCHMFEDLLKIIVLSYIASTMVFNQIGQLLFDMLRVICIIVWDSY